MTGGVNVIGYLRAESGMGEVPRLLIAALRAAEVPYAVRIHERTPSRQRYPFDDMGTSKDLFDTNILCLNAEDTARFVADADPALLAGRRNIGIWAWEVEEFPESLRANQAFVDEVWVYSRHVADAVAPVLSIPVEIFPLPVLPPEAPSRNREQLGLPADGFLFGFCFDFLSVVERKNPFAVIDAYGRAFDPGEGAHLVLKFTNAVSNPDARARLRDATQSRPDIHVVDRYLSAAEQGDLLHALDAYVSLHRAEGFGLTIAESMARGKPVVTTAYSGNLEFTDADNALLVPYTLVPIPPGLPPYPPGARWAEPNVDAAATMMRWVHDHREEAAALGRRGRQDILRRHAPAARAGFLTARLALVIADRPARVQPARPPLARWAATVVRGSTTAIPSGSPFGRAARSLRWRLSSNLLGRRLKRRLYRGWIRRLLDGAHR